jgi:hypothetical protein
MLLASPSCDSQNPEIVWDQQSQSTLDLTVIENCKWNPTIKNAASPPEQSRSTLDMTIIRNCK